MSNEAREIRLQALLAEQKDFLHTSCGRFDSGHEHEAKRIALTLRVLLHDTGRSKSLLRQLGQKDEMAYLDTDLRLKPRNQNAQILYPSGWPIGLVDALPPDRSRGLPAEYRACLGAYSDEFTSWQTFGDWWQRALLRSKEGQEWSRERFVIGMANKEGGAHVDPDPSRWWVALRDGNWEGAGFSVSPIGEEVPIPSLVPAVLRQIAYEVQESLSRTRKGGQEKVHDDRRRDTV